VAQALHPCSPLCFNADRLCWLSRVQAAAMLLPPLKHILLHPAPQLKPHLCLVCLMPCLQRKVVKPNVQSMFCCLSGLRLQFCICDGSNCSSCVLCCTPHLTFSPIHHASKSAEHLSRRVTLCTNSRASYAGVMLCTGVVMAFCISVIVCSRRGTQSWHHTYQYLAIGRSFAELHPTP